MPKLNKSSEAQSTKILRTSRKTSQKNRASGATKAKPAAGFAVHKPLTLAQATDGQGVLESSQISLKGLWIASYKIDRTVHTGVLQTEVTTDRHCETIAHADGLQALRIARGLIHVPVLATAEIRKIVSPKWPSHIKYSMMFEAIGYRALICLAPLQAFGSIDEYQPDWESEAVRAEAVASRPTSTADRPPSRI